jgi:hypothetical protein
MFRGGLVSKGNQIQGQSLYPIRIILAAGVLILLSLACNLPQTAVQEIEDPLQQTGFVQTSIAETLSAMGKQPDAENQTEAYGEDIPPSATLTPEHTATPTLTPTVTVTPTPDIPRVYVSQNTNCRTGPGLVYGWLITMQQGNEPEAIAKDPLEEYWYIRRLDQPNAFCWMWGKYATPQGDTASLPVYTPPPTPTVGLDFKVTYVDLYGPCFTNWVMVYRIDNIGGFTLESWRTSGTDHTGGSNPFTQNDDLFTNSLVAWRLIRRLISHPVRAIMYSWCLITTPKGTMLQ